MTTKTTTGKIGVKKLKLKKETVKDLDVKNNAAVKGGLAYKSDSCAWITPCQLSNTCLRC